MTKSHSAIRARTILVSSILAAGLIGQPALAASACKGLEKQPCDAKDQCYWVDGYTRKDGVKVSAHCRKAPSRKASSSSGSSGSSKPSSKEGSSTAPKDSSAKDS